VLFERRKLCVIDARLGPSAMKCLPEHLGGELMASHDGCPIRPF
jgi:hypothetical protein